jgi:hypothetical protein
MKTIRKHTLLYLRELLISNSSLLYCKKLLTSFYWILSAQFGFDPLRMLASLRSLPHFISDWWKFRKGFSGKISWMPCLHDRYEEGGTTKSEYFWQDLLVARKIFQANPKKHVDIGSRVDGFVAHVASFREIEVFDVRPITAQIPGVVFKQADLMRGIEIASRGYCDSLSCLHAIEHFGLGRYGDPIDSKGHHHGIANMALLLQPGGKLYLSAPIGKERVKFNANRIFDPSNLVSLAENNGLALQQLIVISDGKVLQVETSHEVLQTFAENDHLCIFIFIKI